MLPKRSVNWLLCSRRRQIFKELEDARQCNSVNKRVTSSANVHYGHKVYTNMEYSRLQSFRTIFTYNISQVL